MARVTERWKLGARAERLVARYLEEQGYEIDRRKILLREPIKRFGNYTVPVRLHRDVTVELLSSDADLRFRAWIEHNRQYVEKATDGKVGYVYVPSTGVDGQNELFRQFFGQTDKQALIIDERWNSGGQIPDRFIECGSVDHLIDKVGLSVNRIVESVQAMIQR